jgi:transposase-like protein
LSEEEDLTQEDFKNAVKLDVEARVREGVKAVLEEVLQEEMSEHLLISAQTPKLRSPVAGCNRG